MRPLLCKSTDPSFQYAAVDQELDQMSEKPKPTNDIELWMWLPGLVLVIFAALFILHSLFSMPLLEAAVALVLSLSMSLIAIQATGATGKF